MVSDTLGGRIVFFSPALEMNHELKIGTKEWLQDTVELSNGQILSLFNRGLNVLSDHCNDLADTKDTTYLAEIDPKSGQLKTRLDVGRGSRMFYIREATFEQASHLLSTWGPVSDPFFSTWTFSES